MYGKYSEHMCRERRTHRGHSAIVEEGAGSNRGETGEPGIHAADSEPRRSRSNCALTVTVNKPA